MKNIVNVFILTYTCVMLSFVLINVHITNASTIESLDSTHLNFNFKNYRYPHYLEFFSHNYA